MMSSRWKLRATAPELAARYTADGQWTDETLASVLDRSLRASAGLTLRVWSEQRPFHGTVGRVHELARRVAAGLRAAGVGPGDVVAFQIPSWVEAAATFWGIAQSGATILPIVHFYGPREVGFILRQSEARVFVTADRFRSLDYLASLDAIRAEAFANNGGGAVKDAANGVHRHLQRIGGDLAAPGRRPSGFPAS